MRLVSIVAGWLGGLTRLALLLAILAGVPTGLVTQIGPPWPADPAGLADDLPQRARHLLTGGVSDTVVVNLLAAALWILWLAFAACVLAELWAAVRGTPVRRIAGIGPLQDLAGWLVAGVTASMLATGGVVVTAPPVPAAAVPAPAAATVAAQHPASAVDAGVVAVVAGHPRPDPSTAAVARPAGTAPAAGRLPVYRVAAGDWMVKVAERFLGDQDRYVDIAALNPGYERRDPRFPDHWEPTWQVVLPADAHDRGPRPHATGHLVVAPTPAQPPPGTSTPYPPGGSPTTPPSAGATTAPGASADPDGVVAEPAAPPATPGRSPSPTATGSTGSSTSAAPTQPAPSAEDEPRPGAGVELPGGWIGLPLAAAVLAAAAVVWKRRRHRHTHAVHIALDIDEPDLRPLPPAVTRLRRAVRENAPTLLDPPATSLPTVTDYATGHADTMHLPPIGPSGPDLSGLTGVVPTGGLGLAGDGAEPAARALLVATLSTGSPTDPDACGHVVIPATTLTTLLGAHAVHLGHLPRLTVTPNLSEALTHLDELLIERRRILQDHDTNDLPELRRATPYHPPIPPVLLLADVPPPDQRARLTTTLHLGVPLQITAVLLGDWPRGDTLTVDQHGLTDQRGQRLAVLDIPTTMQLLQVLREAHTGEPAPTAPVETTGDTRAASGATPHAQAARAAAAHHPAPPDTGEVTDQPPDPAAVSDASAASTPAAPQHPASGTRPRPKPQPVRIRLLGPPTIHDRDGAPVPGLRHHARQLLVYLILHRAGADLPDIMEAFWPTATMRRASERLSTEVSDLRGRVRQATADPKAQAVINTGGRYHLNPDLLDIDVWRFADALRRAAASTEPAAKTQALCEAIDAHTGTLADGYDYDWIEPPREQMRRHAITARLHLAELLASRDAHAAADLTRAAAALDPYNEDLARKAMTALARIGDADGIRVQLHQLRVALDEIDEEPSAETIALAAQLQRDLHHRTPPGDDPNVQQP